MVITSSTNSANNHTISKAHSERCFKAFRLLSDLEQRVIVNGWLERGTLVRFETYIDNYMETTYKVLDEMLEETLEETNRQLEND